MNALVRDVAAGPQRKVDGMRARWFAGRPWSREGTPIEGVDHILADRRAAGRERDAGSFFLFDALPSAEWKADSCQTRLTARPSRPEALVAL